MWCLGAFLPGDVDLAATAEDVPPDAYAQGVAVFASGLSPWLHDLAPDRWAASLAGLRSRAIGTLLSTHGLAVGASIDRLLAVAAGIPKGPAFVPPGQEFVDAMLAGSGAH